MIPNVKIVSRRETKILLLFLEALVWYFKPLWWMGPHAVSPPSALFQKKIEKQRVFVG